VREATAFWVEEPGSGALRREPVRPPGDGEVLVRTLWTGVSRGTEATVFTGRVPAGERERMRAPFQEGEFPGPVKYGYLNVGVVEEGPDELSGRTVFTLFPHQSAFVVPASAVVPVPDGVPARRAVLAGAVETAVNVLWDAAPLLGDRMAVIGAGMIGCCVARLAGRLPGAEVTLIDHEPSRAAVAEQLGVAFAAPDAAPRDADLVIHTSGSEAGLRLALETVVTEGVVVEASWYGDREVGLPLGADFHSRRLTIRSSQVGAVAPARRDRRTTTERLTLALRLLRDPAFDALLTGTSPWRELPDVLARLAAEPGAELCRTIDWRDA
jgi:threonine dehydrogenase-like Zn-dependent dehydrogenase